VWLRMLQSASVRAPGQPAGHCGESRIRRRAAAAGTGGATPPKGDDNRAWLEGVADRLDAYGQCYDALLAAHEDAESRRPKECERLRRGVPAARARRPRPAPAPPPAGAAARERLRPACCAVGITTADAAAATRGSRTLTAPLVPTLGGRCLAG